MASDNPTTPTDPVLAELTAKLQALGKDPQYLNPAGSFQLLNDKGRKKADRLARAITDRLAELRAQRGEPVNEAGYTGRNKKRRK